MSVTFEQLERRGERIAYVKLLKECGNNARKALQRVERGDMLPSAVSPIRR